MYQCSPSTTLTHKHYAHSPLSLISFILFLSPLVPVHPATQFFSLTLGLLTLYLLIEVENPEVNSFHLALVFNPLYDK